MPRSAVNVFLWEAMCAGAFEEDAADSLLQEGRVMLTALATDVSRIEGCRVTVLLHREFGLSLKEAADKLRIVKCVASDELLRFQKLAAESDRCWIIAPEIGGRLSARRRMAEEAGGICVGPSTNATDLCSDKLRLAELLTQHEIPTVSTQSFTSDSTFAPFTYPLVVKPRFGAGSEGCRVIPTQADLDELCDSPIRGELIVQPFVPGEALSTAAIVSPDGNDIDVFPTARQLLSDDGRMHYLGGELPVAPLVAEITESLIRRTCFAIPGLRGYVGFDLIRPCNDPGKVMIIEINPRLTTSYIGYRQLTTENMAERVLFPDRNREPICWNGRHVRYFPDGTVVCHDPRA